MRPGNAQLPLHVLCVLCWLLAAHLLANDTLTNPSHRRCVVAAYQAHGGAINALAIGEGVAVTAGDDRCARARSIQRRTDWVAQWECGPPALLWPSRAHPLPNKPPPPRSFLRLWPLDFSSYLLEAEHDAPPTAAALGPGGLSVAVGCEDGSLGVVEVGSRRYAAAVRSHTGAVAAAAAHASRWVRARGHAPRHPRCTAVHRRPATSRPALSRGLHAPPPGPSMSPRPPTAPRASGTRRAATSSCTSSASPATAAPRAPRTTPCATSSRSAMTAAACACLTSRRPRCWPMRGATGRRWRGSRSARRAHGW